MLTQANHHITFKLFSFIKKTQKCSFYSNGGHFYTITKSLKK